MNDMFVGCDYCGGTGQVPHPADDGEESDWTWVPCPKCKTKDFMEAIGAEIKYLREGVCKAFAAMHEHARQRVLGQCNDEALGGCGAACDPSVAELSARMHALGVWCEETLVGRLRELEERLTELEDMKSKPSHPFYGDMASEWVLRNDGWWVHKTGAMIYKLDRFQGRKRVSTWLARRPDEDLNQPMHGPFVDVEEAVAAALHESTS